jgi:uncharacterized cupin superfamily protein
MRPVNENSVAEEHRISPKEIYEIYRKHISLALGGIKDTGEWGGGHPFDVELSRIPAGKSGYPLHSHAAQTEYYIILEGSGLLINSSGLQTRIRSRDHFICRPGEAHQILNDGTSDLLYYVIADHHRADVATYPKTDKRQIKPEYRYFRIADVDYYDGEE